jgi:hypothetical protein
MLLLVFWFVFWLFIERVIAGQCTSGTAGDGGLPRCVPGGAAVSSARHFPFKPVP